MAYINSQDMQDQILSMKSSLNSLSLYLGFTLSPSFAVSDANGRYVSVERVYTTVDVYYKLFYSYALMKQTH